MILTEEEAKSKRCTPMAAAIAVISQERLNELQATGPMGHYAEGCIGSRCAQWRRRTSPEQAERNRRNLQTPIEEMGFCGLAGSPE
jgi:hypothetical protein